MKEYLIDERTLRHLLYCEMMMAMLETDGVDNWSWYGASREEIAKEFYPGDWDEDVDVCFEDIARMRIEAGEFKEMISFAFSFE